MYLSSPVLQVLARSHHPRAYLLPSQHSRKKWEEPTFKPATNPRSLVRSCTASLLQTSIQ